jgi:hypothetical protein
MTGEIEELARLLQPLLAGAAASRREAFRLLGGILPLRIREPEPGAGAKGDGPAPAASLFLPGDREKTVLLLAPVPDPCLAGDNLSGVLLTALLARELLRRRTRFSYQALFLPSGTEKSLPDLVRQGASPVCAAVIRQAAGAGPWSFACSERRHALFSLLPEVFTQFGLAPEHGLWLADSSPERVLPAAFSGMPAFALRKEAGDGRQVDADALSRTLLLHLGVLERLEDEPDML